jgi:DNA-binding NarL/FixJ family response regulator
MNPTISVILVDNHAVFRESLRTRLEAEGNIRVLAALPDAQAAVAESARLQPDVVLMDIDMPGLSSFDAAEMIHAKCAKSAVVFLSAFANDHYIEKALAVDAAGYVVKDESIETLVNAIRKAASRRAYYSPEIQARIVATLEGPRLSRKSPTRASTLTEREIEVLRYVGRGMSDKEIGQAAQISPHTAHRHVVSLMTKLDIHTRVELTRFAIREGLAEA